MKLCTFEVQTQVGRFRRLGAVTEHGVADLNFALELKFHLDNEPQPTEMAAVHIPPDLLKFLDVGGRAMEDADRALAFLAESGQRVGAEGQTLLYTPQQVRLLSPLPKPRSVRDFYSFEAHVKRGFEKRGEPMPEEWYNLPVYYKTAHHNIIGTGIDVPWPSFTGKFDYELELAAVIGRGGRNIRSTEARQHIAGFTIMNDFSARDIQRKEEGPPGTGQRKRRCTAIGPWLVTKDEIPDPYALAMEARVNGDIWSSGNSRDMYWKFEQMIEFLTEDDFIVPGDVIASGTVGGGCGLELDRWVKRGDVLELEIEKIGILRNRVV